MRKVFPLLILLQFATLGQLWAGLDAGLAEKLRAGSAEAFFEAISYELRKSPASKAALDALAPEALAAGLARAASREGLTQAALFRETAALVPLGGLEGRDREKAEKAIEEARIYLTPEELPAWSEIPPPAAEKTPPGFVIYEKGSPETAGTDPALLAWKDAAGYTASRLGPLRAVLDSLGQGDGIILSNLSLGALLPTLGRHDEIISLRLPISGYAKKIWLLTAAGGRKTLLLSDFQGRIFLRHFELLLRSHFSGKPAPAIKVAEALSAYEPYYKALARLHEAKPAEVGELEGLIAGYGESFRLYWSSYAVASVSDSSGDWQLDIYRPAGGGRWAVISARSSFYGETLGENIRFLVERSTGIKSVLIAGSGGSLEPRLLYSLAYPSHVITPGGEIVPNALGSQADFRAHKSALSPLEETPAWLKDALEKGVGTVDVEMGPAAEALRGRDLRLGFAVLVTDFPIHRPAIEKALERASLARQDAGAKYRNLGDYVRGVEEWIARGVPPGWQPIEKKLGRPLAAQSALNLEAEAKGLSPLSLEEEELLAKLEAFFRAEPPSFSVRMSAARAARVLGDEAFLSTELVSSLKGDPVSPFTPDYEQASYRAWRYIFGTLSYWDGPEKYGDTVLGLKTGTWQRRAWGTRRSAMRALAMTAEKAGLSAEKAAQDPALVKEADEIFASWIVTPGDLPRALALQVVGELRGLPAAFQEFLSAPAKELPGLIARHDVGWLEGKIWESAQVGDIGVIKTPGAAPAAVSGPAGRLGIRVISGKK